MKKNFIIFLSIGVIFVIIVFLFALRHPQHNVSHQIVYSDSEPEGVTKNFYQWYTSCTDENKEEDESIALCYEKTTYLTKELITEVDRSQKTILCKRDLFFHTVSVKKASIVKGIATVSVWNSKTNNVVAAVKLRLENGKWIIFDIIC